MDGQTYNHAQEIVEQAKKSTDQITMSVGFGNFGINIPGDDVQQSLRMIYDLCRAGIKPDGIVINNLTTGGVAMVTITKLTRMS